MIWVKNVLSYVKNWLAFMATHFQKRNAHFKVKIYLLLSNEGGEVGDKLYLLRKSSNDSAYWCKNSQSNKITRLFYEKALLTT